MDSLRFECPKCRKRLVLKDRSQRGRMATCPACGHRFPIPQGRADAPSTGTRSSDAPSPDAPSSDTPAPDPSPADTRSVDVPKPSPPQPTKLDAPLCANTPQEPHADASDACQPLEPSERGAPPFAFLTDADPAHERLTLVKRRRRQERRRAAFLLGAVLLLGIGGMGVLLFQHATGPVPSEEQTTAAPVARPTDAVILDPSPADVNPTFENDSPTQGEPIRLFLVPSGARLLVHLRPADLWSDEEPYVELRASLTQNLITSIERGLREITGREPRELEEVLLAWILGARGTEPQIAAVVHLAHEERLSDLIHEFGGEVAAAAAHPRLFLRDDRGVLIRDARTLAFAPRKLAAEMAEWCDTPNHNTSDGVLALLEQTDRRRLLTVVFNPAEVQRHCDDVFAASVRDVADRVASWFAEHAETVAWSIHSGEAFFSEILLRPRSVQSSSTLLERITERMDSVPVQMVAAVRQLNPQRVGFRKLIGRFPAMLEVSRRATVSGIGDRIVRLATTLPPKAGPNLALAAVLTWDAWTGRQSATGPEQEAAPTVGGTARRTVAERLQLPVEAEFTRTPLHEAIAYIAGEIDVRIDIDGDALKEAGYSKNLPQSFHLGQVSAADALQRILQQYQEPGKEMVIVVDERQQRATILTRPVAARRGLEPYLLSP